MSGLYGGRMPHVAGSDTSEAAGESVALGAWTMRRRILAAIYDEPSTCDEIEWRLKFRHQTASPRIRELVKLGFVYDTGARRETRSGRTARVYDVTKAGATLVQLRRRIPKFT